jgi:hypothetical protein
MTGSRAAISTAIGTPPPSSCCGTENHQSCASENQQTNMTQTRSLYCERHIPLPPNKMKASPSAAKRLMMASLLLWVAAATVCPYFAGGHVRLESRTDAAV